MSVAIILVDDHPIVRQGLRSLLESNPEFNIAGEAGDGIEALKLTDRFKPDILVVDLMMPGLNGLEVLRQVKHISPKTQVIILSMQSASPYVMEALKHGAAGYVLKETGPGELVNAIREVVQGNQYLSLKLSERIQAKAQNDADRTSDAYDSLTTREREILQMTAEGWTSQEIGEKLVISPRTVEVHRRNLSSKLGIKNQTELIRFAIKKGILPMEDEI